MSKKKQQAEMTSGEKMEILTKTINDVMTHADGMCYVFATVSPDGGYAYTQGFDENNCKPGHYAMLLMALEELKSTTMIRKIRSDVTRIDAQQEQAEEPSGIESPN